MKSILEFKGSGSLTEQDKKDIHRETEPEREFAEFIKENRNKALIHNFISVAAKSYIDGIKAALRCQQAAQAL